MATSSTPPLTGAAQLQQNATYTIYAYTIIAIGLAFLIYKNPTFSTFFWSITVLSFVLYVYYRTWRYMPQ